MPGPAPKPPEQRRRRNARPAALLLPSEGRQSPAPPWPIVPNPDRKAGAAERKLWAELWQLPQAVAWERFGYAREVAQYARWKILAEAGSLRASAEARQFSDRLGLTPLALRRLEWQIVADELEARQAEVRLGARGRLQAVDNAVAGS